jgi:hypothetical protein
VADLWAEVAGGDAQIARVHLGDGIYVKVGLEKDKAARLVLIAGLCAFAARAIRVAWSFATVWV